jgi:hypothetical protein
MAAALALVGMVFLGAGLPGAADSAGRPGSGGNRGRGGAGWADGWGPLVAPSGLSPALTVTPRFAWPAPPFPADDATPTPSSRAAAPLLARSAPIMLRIPAIRVAAALSTLGLNPDRTVEVPADFQQAGWYRLGPSPGQVGSAVILGHLDSYRGPAVFFRLKYLRPGDRVEVGLADGAIARFAVREVATYPGARFPARRVYGSDGSSALQLVTCGGSFDTRTRHYRSNVVVYTSLVATTGSAAGEIDGPRWPPVRSAA